MGIDAEIAEPNATEIVENLIQDIKCSICLSILEV